jgi:hypothetical protein
LDRKIFRIQRHGDDVGQQGTGGKNQAVRLVASGFSCESDVYLFGFLLQPGGAKKIQTEKEKSSVCGKDQYSWNT